MTTKNANPAAKKATNVSIRKDILAKARALDINLSATLENALLESIAIREKALWREKNREAVKAYNDDIKTHGLFSSYSRSF